jgi:DNA replication protein DnaC
MDISETTVVEESRNCKTHGDYPVTLFRAGNSKLGNTRCPECEKAIEELQKKRAEEQRIRQVEASRIYRHERSRIPLRFKSRRFDNYTVENDGQAKALSICRSYAEHWAKVSQAGTGLIFSGKAGAGKTHLACSIAYVVIEQGAEVQFSTVSEVMRQIKSSFSKDSETTEQDEINHFSNIELLILDEVGMDYGTDFNKALIFEILNKRYENVLPTILLTNLDAPALVEYMGERLVDRMRENGGRMVSFAWDSYRGKAVAVTK